MNTSPFDTAKYETEYKLRSDYNVTKLTTDAIIKAFSKYLIVSDEEADLMFSKSHGDLPDVVKEARDKGGDNEYKMKNKISIYNEIGTPGRI